MTVGIIKLLADVLFLPVFFLTTSFGARFSKKKCKCQRHFVIPGCPRHDPEGRKS